MAKKTIPSIHLPIQTQDGSMEMVWYLYLQWLATKGGEGGSLPDQTGHSGEFLTTDGTDASWDTLATVAKSGSYNDLSNKPTIPAAQVNSDWNAVSGVAQILNKPTIPTVNDATITITQGGVTKGSFTLNQSSGDTIALDAGGGSTEVEWATYGTTTHQQVLDWASAGKEVLCRFANIVFRLSYYNTASEAITFSACQGVNLVFRWLFLYINNNWAASDITGERVFRYSSMPIASSTYVDKLVQYTGTTDANYTNGYFYKCVSDGGTPATYSWVQTDVQPAGGGALPSQTGNSGKFLTTDGSDMSWATNYGVVEYQAPTSLNNYTWYRKYADGWVEQGGISARNTTVTLPVAMSDTNYVVNVSGNATSGNWYSYGVSAMNKTSTTFELKTESTSSADTAWFVCGIAA